MKALAIIAIVLAGLAFFIPLVGIWAAALSSVMGLIAFRSQPTLGGVAIGLNLLDTAFFTPALLIAEGMNQAENGSAGAVYWSWVGFHVVLLVVGIILAKTKKSDSEAS